MLVSMIHMEEMGRLDGFERQCLVRDMHSIVDSIDGAVCARASCESWLQSERPGSPKASGKYLIDPLGDGNAYEVYCDMETAGGGWTLIAETHPTTDASLSLCNADAVGRLQNDGRSAPAPAKLPDEVINAIWDGSSRPTRQILVQSHNLAPCSTVGDSCPLVERDPDQPWDRSVQLDFQPSFRFVSPAGSSGTGSQNLAGMVVGQADLPLLSTSRDVVPWGGDWCGFGLNDFEDHGQRFYYMMTVGPSYSSDIPSSHPCAGTNAGLMWDGEGNYGCSTGITFIR